ncbi:uncharacterized protein BYT42DRAFT_206421 [Radiomyces spectabilis]|uniref:uncharacterized protein n=1 Tax=Radiomyces spectabilis TaxID=64574 RepID=UPI00221F9F64|nr:uncharacterized protein BYT42DRAFT_206421 [Radiomyces spectabilis]KAI8391745.1 hypothetical protein BYT42DRAFT_206421 [Radiomyces spectabilis]
MPKKLRYKDADKDKKQKKHKKHKRSKHSHSHSHSSSRTDYRPPTLYEEEEGWIPPVNSHKDPETAAWNERLFSAMVDDEGQDPFYSQYNDYGGVDTPAAGGMTDEEYRQYIVDGMFRRKNAEAIAAEEKRQAAKEKRRREKEEARRRLEKEQEERLRAQAVYAQLETLRQTEESKVQYDQKWTHLESASSVTKKDIPWPMVGRTFSRDSLRRFLVDPARPSSDNKRHVRKEQLRYHPDKFMHRIMNKFHGPEKERTQLISKINEVSGWLNELWSELNSQ